jgi:protease-4
MKLKILTIFLLLAFVSSAASAQGLLGLFGSGESKKTIRVQFLEGDESSPDEVLLIRIRGVIQEHDEEESMPFKIEKDLFESLKKDLEVARKRRAIKAVLLDINSPGGEVTASDVIYHQIKKMREETDKPVVALIGTMGASGAYYVACAAEKIMAHPTSIIGSIGVLMQSINVQQLAEKIGLKAVTLKSDKTPMKDVLSPFKEMSEEEKTMLLGIIDSIYDRFINIVSENRKLSREDVIKIADGGIYTSTRARELGLIDGVGYREDALAEACRLAEIKSAALVKRVSSKSLSEIIAEMSEMNSYFPNISAELKKLILQGSTMNLMLR